MEIDPFAPIEEDGAPGDREDVAIRVDIDPTIAVIGDVTIGDSDMVYLILRLDTKFIRCDRTVGHGEVSGGVFDTNSHS